MIARFAELRHQFDKEIAESSDRASWERFLVRWTGRKAGILSLITNNWLKPASPDMKRVVGQELNQVKTSIESALAERQRTMEAASEQSAAARDKIDLSLPGMEHSFGTRHLIRQTFEELSTDFHSPSASAWSQGPEIETPYYNFEALNIPEHHPARDNMDTFYIEGVRSSHLLRTHTSPMQIRTMEEKSRRFASSCREKCTGAIIRTPPTVTCSTRLKVWRWTPTSPSAISKARWNISRASFWDRKQKRACGQVIFLLPSLLLKWTRRAMFVAGRLSRLQIFGMDRTFWCGHGESRSVRVCEIRSEPLSGFAFGMGVDRLAMMKYGVTEVPLLFQNDLRFLQQFP